MDEERPKKRRLKQPETVRQRAGKASSKPSKPRRFNRTAVVVGKPLKAARRVGRKEYYLPLPDNKLGRFLNKRRSLIPGFVRNSWLELRQVTWTNARETAKLSFAVMMFALVFGVLIAITDFGLEKLFKEVLIR